MDDHPPSAERAVAARLHPRTGQVQVWPRNGGPGVMRAECPFHPDPDGSLLIKGDLYFCHACGRGGRLTGGT